MKKTVWTSIIVILLGILLVILLRFIPERNETTVQPYLEYVKDGVVLLRIDDPAPGMAISSPLSVRGEARGYWYFEASFPLILVDWDGRIIAQGIATAQGDWMTEELVPFTGELTFETPEYIGDFSRRGALILKKDNPSGLPEHDDAFEIPVQFVSDETP